MDTVSNADYSKFGQLQADDICIPLNSAFWNKDEFNNKMLHSSQTENCPFTLGPTICIENVNKICTDDICESPRSHIVQVHNYLVSSVANPHWFVKYVKSCNAEVQQHSIVTKYQSKTSQNHKNTHKCTVVYHTFLQRSYNFITTSVHLSKIKKIVLHCISL